METASLKPLLAHHFSMCVCYMHFKRWKGWVMETSSLRPLLKHQYSTCVCYMLFKRGWAGSERQSA